MMLENESIYSTFIGRNNALWICAENGGLYRKGLNEQVPSLVSMPEVPRGWPLSRPKFRRAWPERSSRVML